MSHLQKVVDYKLTAARTPDELTDKVKSQMDSGWVPSGTVITHHEELVQALVKFN